ncbi:MAG: hypothetical protein JWP52_198, partial [Rhizobacter sp.]|nr:hypothetical protein [Rhizobacter sp.]
EKAVVPTFVIQNGVRMEIRGLAPSLSIGTIRRAVPMAFRWALPTFEPEPPASQANRRAPQRTALR